MTTKNLLGYGVIAGPLYVVVSLCQALTRDGFDLTRHQWSLLSNGTCGWIQITNFVVTGACVVAAAVGLRRALGPGSRWAPRLLTVYGLSLVAAGLFRADPALGFPPGTPDGPATVSWHGILHFVSGAVGFSCLVVACFVVARRFAAQREDRSLRGPQSQASATAQREDRSLRGPQSQASATAQREDRGWATYSRVTGALFLAGFVSVAAGAGAVWSNLVFVGSVILVWIWLSAVSVHFYQR
jgi:hypothetical protein